MKNLSTFSKSIVMALGIAGIGTASIVAGQAATSNGQISEAMAAVQSKISLGQAMAIAQKTVKGEVISAGFDQKGQTASGKYEVKLVSNNIEYEIDIDANTGKVLKTEQEKLDKGDMAEYSAMKQAKISLNQAMQTAAQSVNGTGKVIEAEFDIENGQAVYEMEVAKGNQIYKVVVDSMTGKVMSTRLDNDD